MHACIQEPVAVALGTPVTTGPRGGVSEEKHTFHYVPLQKGLEALLSHQEICDEVANNTLLHVNQ